MKVLIKRAKRVPVFFGAVMVTLHLTVGDRVRIDFRFGGSEDFGRNWMRSIFGGRVRYDLQNFFAASRRNLPKISPNEQLFISVCIRFQLATALTNSCLCLFV